MGVDFVRSEGSPELDRKKRAGYDIEYTQPAIDQEITPKPRRKRVSFLDWIRKVKAQKPSRPSTPQPPVAKQPSARPTPPSSPIPPPPPPHTPHPPAPPAPHPKPLSKPVESGPPQRVATPPISPRPYAAKAPSAVVHGAERQEVIAHNVASLKGATTQPEATSPGGVDVNLLPEFAANGMAKASSVVRLLRVFAISLWVFSVIYAAMVAYEGYYIFRNQLAQQELAFLNTQIESFRSLQNAVTETNTTLKAIDDLLNQHIYWSNWFSFLEKYTLPDVYYTEFTGNSSGTMNLTAVTDDYETVTQQINAFRAAGGIVESIDVTTATRNEAPQTEEAAEESIETEATKTENTLGLIQFTMTVIVKPELLSYTYHRTGNYEISEESN